MYFRQKWTDSRLANPSAQEVVIGGQSLKDSIWTPDTFSATAESVRTLKDPKPNVFVKVEPNGSVLYSER